MIQRRENIDKADVIGASRKQSAMSTSGANTKNSVMLPVSIRKIFSTSSVKRAAAKKTQSARQGHRIGARLQPRVLYG